MNPFNTAAQLMMSALVAIGMSFSVYGYLDSQRDEVTIADVVRDVSDSVVSVQTYLPPDVSGYVGGQFGTGFFVEDSGIIITNNHVTSGGDHYDITLSDGTVYKARLLHTSKDLDLSLLELLEYTPVTGRAVTMFEGKLRKGDVVIAIGDPLGLIGTVTVGVVSYVDRVIEFLPMVKFVQTDVVMNPGNSGGPLFNEDGKLVGVNDAMLTPDGSNVGLNLAISISTLKEFLATSYAWTGLNLEEDL